MSNLLDDALRVEEQALQQGKIDGIRQGRIEGWLEGRSLGIEKGFQLGQQLGYYQGCVCMLRRLASHGQTLLSDKATRVMRAIEGMLAEFPNHARDENIQEQIIALQAKFKHLVTMLGAQHEFLMQGADATFDF